MGTSLHTSVSTDSIPSATASVPFQNSQTSDFIPQAPPLSDTFNPQIPTDFNFSSNASPNYPQNDHTSDFVPSLDFSMLEPHQFSTSSNPQVNSGDSMLQHLLGEIIALNDISDFSAAVPTVPVNGTMNMDTTFNPHAKSMPSLSSNTSAPFQGMVKEFLV